MINDNEKITYQLGICDDETGASELIGDTAVAGALFSKSFVEMWEEVTPYLLRYNSSYESQPALSDIT